MKAVLRWFLFLCVTFAWTMAVAQVPASQHVVVVIEENHGYNSVIGNPSMPYLNGLANQYASGQSVLREHSSLYRQLFHDDDRSDHHQ